MFNTHCLGYSMDFMLPSLNIYIVCDVGFSKLADVGMPRGDSRGESHDFLLESRAVYMVSSCIVFIATWD